MVYSCTLTFSHQELWLLFFFFSFLQRASRQGGLYVRAAGYYLSLPRETGRQVQRSDFWWINYTLVVTLLTAPPHTHTHLSHTLTPLTHTHTHQYTITHTPLSTYTSHTHTLIPHTAVFKVISGGQSSIDLSQLTTFLEEVMTIGQSVSETPFCSLRAVDICARECFRKVLMCEWVGLWGCVRRMWVVCERCGYVKV